MNLIMAENGYRNQFHRIFVFNPQAELDDTYGKLKEVLELDEGDDGDRWFDAWGDELLKGLVAEKEAEVASWKRREKGAHPPRVDLWLVDDTYGTDMTNPYKIGPLDIIATRGRKIHTSVWFIGHRTKGQVTKTMRSHFTHGIFFRFANAEETDDLISILTPPWMKPKQMRQLYLECTSKPHSFLYFDRKRPDGQQFSCKFDTVLTLPPCPELTCK